MVGRAPIPAGAPEAIVQYFSLVLITRAASTAHFVVAATRRRAAQSQERTGRHEEAGAAKCSER